MTTTDGDWVISDFTVVDAGDGFWVRYQVQGSMREAGPYGSLDEATSHYHDIRGFEGVTMAVVDDWRPRVKLVAEQSDPDEHPWWCWSVMLCPDELHEFAATGIGRTKAEAEGHIHRVVANMRAHRSVYAGLLDELDPERIATMQVRFHQ